jgi:acyl-coenzyme A thioesterase PaaI-like protein
MNDAAIAAALIDALSIAAARETAATSTLVSATIEMLAPPAEGKVETSVTRKTRTLIFMSAELRDARGERIATASSVHKLPGA